MKRAIVTYAAGAHEELLDVSLPTYKDFAHRHGYDVVVGSKLTDMPPAWNKIPLLMEALGLYDDVVWFDCDLVVVNPYDDFPPMTGLHAMVRHFEDNSEVPNSGVWRIRQSSGGIIDGESSGGLSAAGLLRGILALEVFHNHGWWEQAALMTLMGYTVPPEGSLFSDTRCRNVAKTKWFNSCQFMRLSWNSHPMYRSGSPRIVHCSYPCMTQRLEVMRELVKDPHYDYPKYLTPSKEV